MKRILVFAASAVALCLASCSEREATVEEAENAVVDAIMNRRSIRLYKDTPVEREKLQLISECGVYAPNGMNSQRWELRIVDSPELINGISESYKEANAEWVDRDPSFKNMFRNAPAVIFVAIPEGDDGVNAGLLGSNVCLAAYSLGLGTVCMSGPVSYLYGSEEGLAFVEKLNLSEGYKLIYAIGVGYPDETPDVRERDLSKISFVE